MTASVLMVIFIFSCTEGLTMCMYAHGLRQDIVGGISVTVMTIGAMALLLFGL